MTDILNKRIFLKFERLNNQEIKLEQDFQKDEEKNIYIMGFASTPDENSHGFIVENQALLDCWKKVKAEGGNVAVYEKHNQPIGKTVSCEEYNGKILITMEIPKAGNERFISVYEQGIYVGLSIGGWSIDGEWDDNDVYHVTKFDWVENSVTDCPSNENALLLEYAKTTKPVPRKIEEEKEQEEEKEEEKIEEKLELEQNTLDTILEKIRGI